MTMNHRLTGPTPLPPAVLHAMMQQPVSHRAETFRAQHRELTAHLQRLLGTRSLPMLFASSGTGGLEAAVSNVFRPGARVLVASIGLFGERLIEMSRAFGLELATCCKPWGSVLDPEELGLAIERSGHLDGVLVTHNETSTGVLNPLRELAAAVRSRCDALLVVDAVSAAGAVPIAMDQWGIDVLVTASQKALMSPPGLAVVAASPAALASAASCPRGRYYLDLNRMTDAAAEGTTAFTPPVTTLAGLTAALRMMDAEGFEGVFQRHRETARAARLTLRTLGLDCFSPEAAASPTVTCVPLPRMCFASQVRRVLAERHEVAVSQGRGCWKERMIRIGHMGHFRCDEVIGAVRALAAVVMP
jgi:aspartate aminotransferase-like enzyme